MSFLDGVHGTVAAILICALLFIDEAGVPLPFAPNELLLIVSGALMATGGLEPVVFYPMALLAMGGGVMTGYYWARAIGPAGLRALAERVRGGRAYDRVTARMRRADPWDIAVMRMIPGVRVYATLVSGATEIPPRTFALGALPATAVWCAACTLLGVIVGRPAEHFFNQLERLLFTGGIYVLLAFFCLLAARRVPSTEPRREALRHVPRTGRVLLALGLDMGIVGVFTAGVDRITRFVIHAGSPDGRNDLGILVAVVTIAYILASRRIPGVTAGEGFFNISYQTVHVPWHRGRRRRLPDHPATATIRALPPQPVADDEPRSSVGG